MRILNQKAVLTCAHLTGVVGVRASQRFVRISGHPVVVKPDPIGKPIVGCPNIGPSIKPCTSTLTLSAGYSEFIKIGGCSVCLDNTKGLTDGTPPGSVKYSVKNSGQPFVEQR